MRKDDYQIHHIDWQGITIEIRWNHEHVIFDDNLTMAHLEIETISPARSPLPMTEVFPPDHVIFDLVYPLKDCGEGTAVSAFFDADQCLPDQHVKTCPFRLSASGRAAECIVKGCQIGSPCIGILFFELAQILQLPARSWQGIESRQRIKRPVRLTRIEARQE